MTEQLRIDRIACKAHGLCAELLPEVIELDEWGYPILAAGSLPAPLRAEATEAVGVCPTLALRLTTAR